MITDEEWLLEKNINFDSDQLENFMERVGVILADNYKLQHVEAARILSARRVFGKECLL